MKNNIKKQIRFARTYRHLEINKWESRFYLYLFVFPFLLVILFYYTEISYWIALFLKLVLQDYIPANQIGIESTEFLKFFGEVYYITIPTTVPDRSFTLFNLLIVMLLSEIFLTGNRAGKPISIYIVFASFIHFISCSFFIFLSEYLPYTASQYSELYIKQELSIWISFVVILGFLMGFLGFQGTKRKMLTMIGVMSYSFIFGVVRYIFFMYVIYRFSVLYMAVQFFLLGPFFDFLYFVYFYGIYVDKSIMHYDSDVGSEKWKWA